MIMPDSRPEITLTEFQQLIRQMYLEKDIARGIDGTFMWLMEEVGELASALRNGSHEERTLEFADVLAWLATIARNRAVDRLRALPARGALASIDVAGEIADGGASPLQTATAADDRTRLEACMEQLEPRRRGLIRAAFFDGSTYEELAERIASPLGSVKSWIRRGLLQLRGCLDA